MAKQWKINELETGLTPVTLSYVDDDGVTQSRQFTTAELQYSLRRYDAWTFIDYTGSLKADVLTTNWVKWLSINKERFDRIFRTFNERYNPLENYLKHGHIETNRTHNNTVTDDIGERTATATPSTITTDAKERSADGAQLGTTNETVTTASNTTSTSGAYTDAHSDNGSDSEIIEDSTHGNIGTTRADEMAFGEYKLRQIVLCDEMIDAFVYDNAYFCLEDLF